MTGTIRLRTIKKAVRQLLKETGRKIDFVSLERYAESKGYKVIFFNTPAGDREVERYNLWEDTRITNAFVYKSTGRIIFINNECASDEKVCLLCHEIGHLALKHIDYKRLSTVNKVLIDIETDVFAYLLLNARRTKER